MLMVRLRNTVKVFVDCELPTMTLGAFYTFQSERVNNIARPTLGTHLRIKAGIDVRLCSALQAQMRDIIRNALLKLIMVGVVGVDLVTSTIKVKRIAVRPCFNGVTTASANEPETFRHRGIPLFDQAVQSR